MSSFSEYKAPQLKECAKHFKIKGTSKMKKTELSALLSKHLKIMKNGEVKERGRGGNLLKPKNLDPRENVKQIKHTVGGKSVLHKVGHALDPRTQQGQDNDRTILEIVGDGAPPLQRSKKPSPVKMPRPPKVPTPKKGSGVKSSDAIDAISLLEKLGYTVKKKSEGGDADAEETTQKKSSAEKGAEKVGDIAYKQGSKKIKQIGQEMSDDVVTNQDFRDTSNPDFVEEEGFGPDLGRALPVLDGPAKTAADMAGKKLDAYTVGIAVAAMKEAGVPPKVADDLKELISPYKNLKYGFKVLKTLGRQGKMTIPERGHYAMEVMSEASPECAPATTGVHGGADLRDCMKIYDAGLLAFDLTHLSDPSTQYAFDNRKRPYVNFLGDPVPEYVNAMEQALENAPEYDETAPDGATGNIAPYSGGETKEERMDKMPTQDDYADFAKMMQGGSLDDMSDYQKEGMMKMYKWCQSIGNKLACSQPTCKSFGLCDEDAANKQKDPIYTNQPQKKPVEQEAVNKGYDIHTSSGQILGRTNTSGFLVAVYNYSNGHWKNVTRGPHIDTSVKDVENGQILVVKDKNIRNGFEYCDRSDVNCGPEIDPRKSLGFGVGGQLPKKTLDKMKGLPAPSKGGSVKDGVDWEDLSWGSFTAQLERYNSQSGKKMTLPQFSEMILEDPKKYASKTVKRARFYKNVLSKK